jgi:hypothetical protein
MTSELPFDEAIATLPTTVRYWIMWMNVTTLSALVIFALNRPTWPAALILLLTNVAMVATMMWLYGQVGFVRLLGLPHLIFWTPLVVWFALRLRRGGLPRPALTAMLILTVTLSISLVFDTVDVVRWLLGERASMLPA